MTQKPGNPAKLGGIKTGIEQVVSFKICPLRKSPVKFVVMLPIVHHPDYTAAMPTGHRFPMDKFRLVMKRLLDEGVIQPDQVHRPKPASKSTLALVHDQAYVDAVFEQTVSDKVVRRIGLPITDEVAKRLSGCQWRHDPDGTPRPKSRACLQYRRRQPSCVYRSRVRVLHLQRCCGCGNSVEDGRPDQAGACGRSGRSSRRRHR